MVKTRSTDVLSGIASSSSSSSGSIRPVMLGRFRLIGLLGEGAMGKVIRAEDTKLKRLVALKCLKAGGEGGGPSGDLLAEARGAAGLDHPGIVQVYDVGEAEGYSFIAMELIEGGTLESLVRGCGALDVHRACQLCAEAAEALAYAGEQGVVHRDIKPQNLLLTRAGRCKIADFGLAHFSGAEGECGKGGVGTPQYMAPELIAGERVTGKADVYSLGGVLYFLLTGAPPFVGESREEVLRMQVMEKARDVRERRPDVPASIAEAIAGALAKDPEKRPAAEAFARKLRSHTMPLNDSQVLSVGGAYVPAQQEEAHRPSPWILFGTLVFGTVFVIAVVLLASVEMWRSHGAPQVTMAAVEPQAEAATAPALLPQKGEAAESNQPEVVAATDVRKLAEVASRGRTVRVTAFVSGMYTDRKAGMAVLQFAESPDLLVVYKRNLYGQMARRFGGKDGSGVQRFRVRVTGVPQVTGGKFVIEIRHARQIELVD